MNFMSKLLSLTTICSVSFLSLNTTSYASYTDLADEACETNVHSQKSFCETQLELFRSIKQSLDPENPYGSYSEELGAFTKTVLDQVGNEIPETDERYDAFAQIRDNTIHLIQDHSFTLNDLNWLTVQLGCALNPKAKNSTSFLQYTQHILDHKLWQLSFLEAQKTTENTISKLMDEGEALENSELAKEKREEADKLLIGYTNFFIPLKMGLTRFPLVGDCLFDYKTYIQGFIEGIVLEGLPLKPENCCVHNNIIKEGDFPFFVDHDRTHLNTLLPTNDEVKNTTHISKIRNAFAEIENGQIFKSLNEQEAHETYIALFTICNEITDYIGKELLFTDDLSSKEVLKKMIEHSRGTAEKFFSRVENREKFYKPSDPKQLEYSVDVFNEDGQLDSFELPESYVQKKVFQNMQNRCIGLLYKLDENGKKDFQIVIDLPTYHNYSNQKQFVYSFTDILKDLNNGDLGQGTYGETLETFNPLVANEKFQALLDRFEKRFLS